MPCHCNAGRQSLNTLRKMKCPRDNSVLKDHKKGNLEIKYCPECSGFFVLLEQEAASKIEAQLKGHFARLHDTGQESPPVPSDSDSSMKSFVYRGVHLDYCIENHAIWFDRGEYTKIFAANSTGKKSLSKEEGQSAWDSLDIVSIPLDIIEISGDVFEGLGGFIADAVSSVDIF